MRVKGGDKGEIEKISPHAKFPYFRGFLRGEGRDERFFVKLLI
jgi:hypothetical protein